MQATLQQLTPSHFVFNVEQTAPTKCAANDRNVASQHVCTYVPYSSLTPTWLFASIQEGRGSWSNIAIAQTAAVPPDSPSMPTVMGSNRTSVSIRWQAPEADGGSPVSSYQVELRPKSKAGLAGMTDEWLTVYQVQI